MRQIPTDHWLNVIKQKNQAATICINGANVKDVYKDDLEQLVNILTINPIVMKMYNLIMSEPNLSRREEAVRIIGEILNQG